MVDSSLNFEKRDKYTLYIGTNYKDTKEPIFTETTLVYTFYEVTEDQINSILDEAIKELNQQSILVEKDNIYYTYH